MRRFYALCVKRYLSSVLAFLFLLLFWWVYLIIAVAIRLDSPGPVFFRQKRVGIGKSYFEIYKFRTMRTDTPHDVPTHLLDADKYVTRVGRFLRKHSLDELPQIFNVLSLDPEKKMVFVGPRPALWNQDDLIAERDRYGANDIYPGITGWAQVNGRDTLEIPEKARLDGYYAGHVSPLLDIKCILKTFTDVFSGEGVVEGGTGAMKRAEEAEPHQVRKRVLIITNHSYMLWQFRGELIMHLLEDYDVTAAMPFVGHEKDFEHMGVRCIRTDVDRRGTNPIKDLRLIRQYRRILDEEKPALVITYSIKPNIYAGFLCGKQNIPYCANVQGLGTAFESAGLAAFVSVLYRAALRKARTVFFENEKDAELFRRRHIVPEQKIHVLRGAGVDLADYPCVPYPANDPVHFLYIGRIMKEKGMDELFYAAERLHEEGYSFFLDLVGFYEDSYEGAVRHLEQEGIAKFHGFKEDPRPYYASCDCVVMPSYHEGMSNVNLEASATGRPVITTYIPGCREAVDMPETGMLVRVKDRDSLYRAMKKFLALSPKRRERMGKNARAKMEREFDRERVVRETIREIGPI
ncbi:MAG: sugar transferase [Eubacteriales bacterium]|jgi:lipopolysaccharide/colanic/teichoic acid biosynthesis glycosyltransferase